MPMNVNATLGTEVQGVQITDALIAKLFNGEPDSTVVRKPGELLRNVMVVLYAHEEQVTLETAWNYVQQNVQEIT